jgi:hypothetical protein
MNFSSKYFSCANNVNAHTIRYHIVEEVPLSELSIFQWKGKGVGAPNAHYVTDDEWNYTILYMYTNMEEVQPYSELFDKTYWKWSGQPRLKQLDSMRQHGVKSGPSFPKWFRLYVIFRFALFSFLMLFHLSHTSNWHSSITPLYVVYAGCQCVWWLMTAITWLGESIGIWPLWYQWIPFLDGEVRSESSTCCHNK